MDLSRARVTHADGQAVFHRLIRQYKGQTPRAQGQSAEDYQQEAEAAARQGLRLALEELVQERIAALIEIDALEAGNVSDQPTP